LAWDAALLLAREGYPRVMVYINKENAEYVVEVIKKGW
jgi:hypothetical protein